MGAEVAHLLAGAALAFGFAIPTRRRLAALLQATRAQSVLVAATAAWQAAMLGSAALAGLAAVVLAAGVALPLLFAQPDERLPAPRAVWMVAGGAALVALAVVSVLPVRPAGLPADREDLAFAVGVVLLALASLPVLPAIGRRFGLVALANGVVLAATVLPPSLGTAGAVLGFYAVAAAWRLAEPAA